MPRDGNGLYGLPAGTAAEPNELADANDVNERFDDLANDNNQPRPISSGGTGATNEAAARLSLGLSAVVSVNAGNHTALSSDRSKLLRFTASATLSLTSAASVGDGWFVRVHATGGVVTIDPNGSETIEGAATYTLTKGMTATIHCDGTSFFITALSPYYEVFHDTTGAASYEIIGNTLRCWGDGGSAGNDGWNAAYPKTFARAPNPVISYQGTNQPADQARTAWVIDSTKTVNGFSTQNRLFNVNTVVGDSSAVAWSATGEWDGVS